MNIQGYSPLCVLLREDILGDLCGGFVEESRRWSVTSVKLHGGFVRVAPQHGCSPVNLLRMLRGVFS